jgi:hypothetical protein
VIRRSTVPREIRLEEKREYVPTPMVEEPFFSVSDVVTLIVQGNVVAEPVVDSHMTMATTPIVDSLMAESDEEEEHVFSETYCQSFGRGTTTSYVGYAT